MTLPKDRLATKYFISGNLYKFKRCLEYGVLPLTGISFYHELNKRALWEINSGTVPAKKFFPQKSDLFLLLKIATIEDPFIEKEKITHNVKEYVTFRLLFLAVPYNKKVIDTCTLDVGTKADIEFFSMLERWEKVCY